MTQLMPHTYYQTVELHSLRYQSEGELCFTLATFTELKKQALNFLHPEELSVWTSLQFEKRQHSYLLGRYTAKQAISRYDATVSLSSILIKPGIFGYPVAHYLCNERIQTTISHCGNLGTALAFPEASSMGIDIEIIKPAHTITINTCLTHKEKRLISTYPYVADITYDILCTVFWTIKEALSKALRAGMLAPLEIYAVKNIVFQDNCWISEFENFNQYHGISFLLEQQICSIVYPKQTSLAIDIPSIQAWIKRVLSV